MKIYEDGFEFEHTINISPLCMAASGYPHQARARVLVNARDSERIAFTVALENIKEQILASNPAILKKALFCELAMFIPCYQNSVKSVYHTAEPYIEIASSYFIGGVRNIIMNGGKNLIGFSVVKFSINSLQSDNLGKIKFNLFEVPERNIGRVDPKKFCQKDKYSCLKFDCYVHGESNDQKGAGSDQEKDQL